MLLNVQNQAQKLELLRVQFKVEQELAYESANAPIWFPNNNDSMIFTLLQLLQTSKGLEDCYKQRSDQLKDLKEKLSKTEKEIADMEASEEELKAEMQSFVEHDLAL